MSKLAKVIIATGTIGTLAGIGYTIVSNRRELKAVIDDRVVDLLPDQTNVEPPLSGPKVPLDEPTHPRLHTRLTRSTVVKGTVQEPPYELLARACQIDPFINMGELTGARLAKSEHGKGSFTELCCIVDSELNRARMKKISLFRSLTKNNRFGKQERGRPASTRLDPTMRHLLAARAVLRGDARGVSRGSTRFFDPLSMEWQHRKYRKWLEGGKQGKKPGIVSCDALGLLEVWCFDYGKKGKNRCPPDRSRRGRDTLAWVGPIPGVDPGRLTLMKPMRPGPEHTRRYEAARDLLRRRLKKD